MFSGFQNKQGIRDNLWHRSVIACKASVYNTRREIANSLSPSLSLSHSLFLETRQVAEPIFSLINHISFLLLSTHIPVLLLIIYCCKRRVMLEEYDNCFNFSYSNVRNLNSHFKHKPFTFILL